jgi:peptide/nickel transport system substrate-binding protein
LTKTILLKLLFTLSMLFVLASLSACGLDEATPTIAFPLETVAGTNTLKAEFPGPTATYTPLPPLPRLLTVCLGREPGSLFLYDANSIASRGVLDAIYDGPFDTYTFNLQPVILDKTPSLADGNAALEPVQVEVGDLILDSTGNLTTLEEGVVYRPTGCTETACATPYSGDQPVEMDQLIVRFTLLTDLVWSDGAPLTSGDSVYSFEVASQLYPTAQPERVDRTQSYVALDERTVEWTGVPGYVDALYHTKFFTPLPRHVWGNLAAEELRTAEISSRKPLGWGPYVIDEWVAGDHISLHRNPLYFRSAESLPYLDNLVYRFVANNDEALEALLAGECDFIDQTAMLESESTRLLELQESGQLSLYLQTGTAWELVALGIGSLEENRPDFFGLKEVRQAVAMCIDRQAIMESLSYDPSLSAFSYVQPSHPFYNSEVERYRFDPQAASELLESVGWVDLDDDPNSPRTAQGIVGVPEGISFEVDYLVGEDDERISVARVIQESLALCGLGVNITPQDFQDYLAPGPKGPVFGRTFDMAQYGWITALEPPCYLYLTDEIPGPYPDFPKGWGGVNASGYSEPEYDQACQDGLFSLADTSQHREAHLLAQSIFSEDVPSIPLYWRFKIVVTRPDMCGVMLDSSSVTALWNIEEFDYGEVCNGSPSSN